MRDDERDDEDLLGESKLLPGIILVVALVLLLAVILVFKVVNGS